MIIIAIDPGYDRCGIAVLEKEHGEEKVIFSECFQTDKKDTLAQRIFEVGSRIEYCIQTYNPSHLVIEDLFFSNNTKTAMAVSQVRGVIIFQGYKYGLEVFEYTPNQIKVAVTGYGSANKTEVTKMVERLVPLEKRKYIDDEIDAIAVGLTFLASYRFTQKI